MNSLHAQLGLTMADVALLQERQNRENYKATLRIEIEHFKMKEADDVVIVCS